MTQKRFARIVILGLFFCFWNIVGYAQSYESLISENFKNISIKIPNYLDREKETEDGKAFSDTNIRSFIIIITKPTGSYDFFKKIYFPSIDPIAIMWNRHWKSHYKKIDKMEKVDFGYFYGFVTKGIMSKDNNQKYMFDYQLFDKENRNFLSVIIGSDSNYLFSEEEANHIISTIRVF